MDSGADTARAVGFPIRNSTDQSLLAAPHGLSQRATSFVASQRQGIHPMPLLCSILEMVSRNSPTQRHAQDQAPSRRTRARDGSQLCQTSRSSDPSRGPWIETTHLQNLFTLSKTRALRRICRPRLAAARQNRSYPMSTSPAPSGLNTAHALPCGRGAGGGERVRTDDPLLAKQVLSQLSYTPGSGGPGKI